MDFRFSSTEEAFREEIQDWLKDNLPDSWKGDRFTRGEGDETRNVYREFINPDCDPRTEARTAKLTSLAAKVGALLFIMLLRKEYAIRRFLRPPL